MDYFEWYLPKEKKLSYDFNTENFKLTSDESENIKYWLKIKSNKNYILPTILKISNRIHLDFIGWDNEEFFDVLVCKNKTS
ncbi:MAG: hypothetical protein WDZ41_00165 [Candidatus Babeliales bacterium]